MTRKDLNRARHNLHHSQGDLAYSLEVFGDGLGEQFGWKNDLDGFDAIRFYLMQKHHWLPAQLNAMTYEDLRFAMTEEMHGWTLPAEARV